MDEKRDKIKNAVEQEYIRVRRRKWITLTLWILWALFYVIYTTLEGPMRAMESEWGVVFAGASFWTWVFLFVMAISSSISWYTRSQVAYQNELRMRLDLIEEQFDCVAGKL